MDELPTLEAEARRTPGDPEIWVRLARAAARSEHRSEWLAEPARLPDLLAAWAERPEERSLAGLVLPLLRCRPDPAPTERPGRFWTGSGRLAEADGLPYDRETGLPLRVTREVDGAVMGLVPDLLLYVDLVPVTWRAFRLFEVTTGYARQWWGDADDKKLVGRRPELPVFHVNREDARNYGDWVGARLPLEAEWEAAAGPDRYPWGDDPPTPERANYDPLMSAAEYERFQLEGSWPMVSEAAGTPGELKEVGQLPAGAGPYGMLDLLGGLWEWCGEPGQNGYHRGGLYFFGPDQLSIAAREVEAENVRDDTIGFRLVRDLS